MKKITLLLVGILLLAALTSGCSSAKQSLTVGVMPDLDSIPFIVAKQQGYFANSVTISIFNSPVDRDSALYSGNMDGSVSDVLAVCLAKNGGFDVAITSKTNGKYGLLASPGSGITTVSDLKGKQIGMSLNTIIEYVTDSILKAEGLKPDDAVKTSIPKIPSRLELLLRDKIPAIAIPEPYVTAAAGSGATVLATSTDLSINPGIFLFKKEALENKNSEIKAFYNAYNKAVKYIAEHPKEDFMPAVIKELGLPDGALNMELPAYEKATLPDENQVLNAMQWLLDKGLIKQAYTYDELTADVK